MLLIVVCALIIVTFILSIHYSQHFKLICKPCNSNVHTRNYHANSTSIMETQFNLLRTTRCHFRCCVSFVPLDDEDFDFFPVSFLLYLLFMAALFLLLVIVEILHFVPHTAEESAFDLIFGVEHMDEHHSHPSFATLRTINTVTIIDYILVYSTVILFIWVSLFAFYRYYTTFILMQTMRLTSNKPLFQRFTIYAVVFCAAFILQIHLHYYLWSLVIVLFCAFNWYCNYMFSKILIEKIQDLIGLADTHTPSDQEMLSGVIFTKNTSLICCALQSINLSVFVITYNVNTLYYLSLLWSISAFILGANFVRNRKWMTQQLYKCKRYMRCLCTRRRPKKVKTRIAKSIPKPQPPTHTHAPVEYPPVIKIQKSKSAENCRSLHTAETDVMEEVEYKTEPYSKTPPPMQKSQSLESKHKIKSKPPLMRAFTDPMAISNNNEKLMTLMDIESGKCVESEEEVSNLEMEIQSPEYVPPPKANVETSRRNRKSKVTLTLPGTEAKKDFIATPSSVPGSAGSVSSYSRKQKALELLGIAVSTPKTPGSQSTKLRQLPKPTQVSKKQTSSTISTTIGTKGPSIKKQVTSSRSTYVTMDSDEESTPTPGPTPMTAAVTAATPLDTVTPAIDIPMGSMNDHDRAQQYLHYTDSCVTTPDPLASAKSHSAEEAKHAHEAQLEEKYDDTAPQRPSLRHSATHSAPVEIYDNHHQAFLSLDILAKYGFCDKTSINSAKQLREYQRKTPLPSMATLDEEL